jgi:hypothetical protein
MGWRSGRAGWTPRMAAGRVRVPLVLSVQRAGAGTARRRRGSGLLLRQRVRAPVGAVWRGRRPSRPRADARVAGGGSKPRRRRVGLPRHRVAQHGLSGAPARARSQPGRHQRAGARAGRGANRPSVPPARARRGSQRGRPGRARGQARPRCRTRRVARRSRCRRRCSRRRDPAPRSSRACSKSPAARCASGWRRGLELAAARAAI